MILYPLNTEISEGPTPVWQAVERRQKEPASEWRLVAQPDHAALAGDLARRLSSALFPPMDDDVFQGIALHDEGWAAFDSKPRINDAGRPTSFLELLPSEFVSAWRGSIERAERVAPISGIIVSGHFSRLGHHRLTAVTDTPNNTQVLRDFLNVEKERQRRLDETQSRSSDEIRVLVDVLQFCDVLSLYLCCGSHATVEFPQKFKGASISLRRDAEMCVMTPPIIVSGASLAVRARHYPRGDDISIPVLLS